MSPIFFLIKINNFHLHFLAICVTHGSIETRLKFLPTWPSWLVSEIGCSSTFYDTEFFYFIQAKVKSEKNRKQGTKRKSLRWYHKNTFLREETGRALNNFVVRYCVFFAEGRQRKMQLCHFLRVLKISGLSGGGPFSSKSAVAEKRTTMSQFIAQTTKQM